MPTHSGSHAKRDMRNCINTWMQLAQNFAQIEPTEIARLLGWVRVDDGALTRRARMDPLAMACRVCAEEIAAGRAELKTLPV